MKNRHLERVWLGQSFLDEAVLIYPVYAIMMLERGVVEFELSQLFILWTLAALLFEIPSGVIGDLVNRKLYVAVGSSIRAAGYLAWLFFPSFWGYALGFLLWAAGSSIHSGTMQSLLHDALLEQGRVADFARVYGRGKALESLGVLVAMAVGGFAATTGYTHVLILSTIAPLAGALLLLLCLSEPARSHADPDPGVSGAPLRIAFRTMLGNRSLVMIAGMFVFFMGMSGVVDEYLGPLLAEPGVLSLGVIGVLYGTILGARAVGTTLAHRLRSLGLRQIGLVSLLAHALLLVCQAGGIVWVTAGSALYFALMGAVEVMLETNLQREIDVHARATITSLAGAGLELWGICLYLLIGISADSVGWAGAIALAAAVAMLLSAMLAYSAGPRAARRRS